MILNSLNKTQKLKNVQLAISLSPGLQEISHSNDIIDEKNQNENEDNVADEYYNSRAYESRIGAWASKQSEELNNRDELISAIEEYKKKYKDSNNVPRPNHWSGWNLSPLSIEFWLDGDSRIHERLKYSKQSNDKWIKSLLSP